MDGGWNHNIHYHNAVLAALPSPCRRALDVGCGEGLLSRQLAVRCDEVTGIDLDEEVIAAAKAHAEAGPHVRFLVADGMTGALPLASFDAITVVATLHHLPLRPALTRFRELLSPGGVLVVVGLYRTHGWAERAVAPVVFVSSLRMRRLRGYQPMTAPMSEPKETFEELRAAVSELLPGAILRRRWFFRYTLIWRKPLDSKSPPSAS